jgi:ribonuclease VapC
VAARADIFISSVNYAEVVSKLVKDGASQEQVEVLLGPLKGRVLPFTQNQAELCGLLIRETGAFGLSLGDRACLSLAKELGAVAWTADRAWAKLAGAIEIEVIRGEDENAS